ncbi:MAG: cobalamin biosynthesis protein CbiA [Calditrichaeota bacterium]|nr:MAG: cobalamin biosynthesis protein CbiA [Calditrichota bacterium]
MTKWKLPHITKPINIIVGGYGSGKSEVSVNLARTLVLDQDFKNRPISILDLDIVNPYFRSREASVELEKLGIEAINPEGSEYYADLPIILPQIKGVIQNAQGTVICDVGGDDVGARVLSSLETSFHRKSYDMFLVLNANRPFTSSVASTQKLIGEIESSSRLRFSGIISNSHLMDYTTADTIIDGIKLSEAVSKEINLPITCICAETKILDLMTKNKIKYPVLPLNRSLLKPWE